MDVASRLTLDREALKVLASDTRLDILKALDERQKTVTELSREMRLNKATVFEHLDKLRDAGLVQRLDDDRKWVYWQLSWKARRLLHPGATTIALMLASSLGLGVTAIVAYVLYLGSAVREFAGDRLGAPGRESSPTAGADDGGAPAADGLSGSPAEAADAAAALAEPLLYAAIILAAVTLALVVGAYVLHRRHRADGAAA